ncbi:MAG: hypothetical protein CEE43_00090 [Promethearchaeota archaeon Loki_b32]|nr:MAG: hypothetical protein CEE43_00090 [Candidatus Lokiarchaeota archaeon Loki_b32]
MKINNPRILHLLEVSLPILAGYTIRTHNILQEQQKYVYPLALIDPKIMRNKNPYIKNGVPYYKFPPFPGYNLISDSKILKAVKISKGYNLINTLLFTDQKNYLSKFVEIQKIDLIHAHTPARFAKYGYKIAKSKNIPFIYEVRYFPEDSAVASEKYKKDSFKYKRKHKKETKLMKKADAVITLGKAMKNDIKNRGIAEEKIYIVPNGVDTKKFVPLEPNQCLKIKLSLQNKKVIGYIGSIRRIEGIEILLKSFSLLKKTVNDVKLLIVGPVRPYDYLESLKDYSKILNIKKDVIFTGMVPYEEVNNYYSIIDIFVIPRLNLRLTRLVTPLKPLEVMAMGKVLITSDLPALKELVKQNISGDLFKVENSKALAIKLEKYLKTPEKAEILKQSAREYVVNNYSWSEIVKKYIPIYDKLLK